MSTLTAPRRPDPARPHDPPPPGAGAAFRVVHPLDDAPEAKLFLAAETGRMTLTPAARAALLVLRAYLLLITLLVAYRCVQLFTAGRG